MPEIFQVPASLYKITTMSQWIRIMFDTSEINPEAISRIWAWKNKEGYLTFNIQQIQPKDIVDLPPIEKRPEDTKSPSQQLHTELWLLWKVKPEGYDNPEDHYRAKIAKLIDWVRQQRL